MINLMCSVLVLITVMSRLVMIHVDGNLIVHQDVHHSVLDCARTITLFTRYFCELLVPFFVSNINR